MYEYNAEVTRIVDADTFDAVVDLGFFIKITLRFRVRNYDAPETWRPRNNAELEHGKRATEYAKTLLNKPIRIKSFGIGIYGRFSADVTLFDGRDYVAVMKDFGFSKLDNYDLADNSGPSSSPSPSPFTEAGYISSDGKLDLKADVNNVSFSASDSYTIWRWL